MGRRRGGVIKYHHGHWWCLEGHLITIAPVPKRQISPKSRLEKSSIQGYSHVYGDLNRTWVFSDHDSGCTIDIQGFYIIYPHVTQTANVGTQY